MTNSNATGQQLAILRFYVAAKRSQSSLRTMSLPTRMQPPILLRRMKPGVPVAFAFRIFCTPSPTCWSRLKKNWAALMPSPATAITGRACDVALQLQKMQLIRLSGLGPGPRVYWLLQAMLGPTGPEGLPELCGGFCCARGVQSFPTMVTLMMVQSFAVAGARLMP